MNTLYKIVANSWEYFRTRILPLVRLGRPNPSDTAPASSKVRGSLGDVDDGLGEDCVSGADGLEVRATENDEMEDASDIGEGKDSQQSTMGLSVAGEAHGHGEVEGGESGSQPPYETEHKTRSEMIDEVPAGEVGSGNICLEDPPHEPRPSCAASSEADSQKIEADFEIERPRRLDQRRDRTASGVRRSGSKRAKQPQLTCQKILRPATWGLVLDLSGCESVAWIRQGDQTLSPDGQEVLLRDYRGEVTVEFTDGSSRSIGLFRQNRPIVFRMRQQWRGEGHPVGRIGAGYYLVVAPSGCPRIGSGDVAGEDCVDTDFMVHYFRRDTTDEGPSDDGFVGCNNEFLQKFVLFGETMQDSLSNETPLYIDPNLKFVKESGGERARLWNIGTSKWSSSTFMPTPESLADNLGRRWGKYMLSLVDSNKLDVRGFYPEEFRYCPGLRQILVEGRPFCSQECWVPGTDGHKPVQVQFVDQDGNGIVANPVGPFEGKVDQEARLIEIPADQDADETIWELRSPDGDTVCVGIHLPRLWWRLVVAGEEDGKWVDTCRSMTLDEFRILADNGAWVEINCPPAIARVHVGIDDDLDQQHRVTRGFPLSAVADYLEPSTETRDSWCLCMKPDDGLEQDIVLFRIVREQAKRDESESPMEDEDTAVGGQGSGSKEPEPVATGAPSCSEGNSFAEIAPAQVRGGKGWRHGRGYSKQELRECGIKKGKFRRAGGRVDGRRRSGHSCNVMSLKGGYHAKG